MQAETRDLPDWHDAGAYAPLLEADRSLFAWEWLRRDTRYRAAVREHVAETPVPAAPAPDPQAFGLVAFEPPRLAVPDARPVWDSNRDPHVLRAGIAPRLPVSDRVELRALGDVVRVIAGRDIEHLLLSDGLRTIRLDAPSGAFSRGAVGLNYCLAGLGSAQQPLVTLRRFLALCRTGQFSMSLHRPHLRARRWILLLRTRDALASGADQRAIAEALLSRSVTEPGWRDRESSVRSQAQRLVRAARQMSAGDYRALLR